MRKDERLDEILRHAAQVFYAKGYDRASIRDIAKKAEMSLAGLYYYFSSKEELLFMIQEQIFSDLLDRARKELQSESGPVDRLRAFIGNHLSYFIENLVEMKVLSHEFERLEGENHRAIAKLRREYFNVTERLVKGVLDSRDPTEADPGPGDATRVDPRTAALGLFGMMNWIYTWYREDVDGDADRVSERITRLYLHGLLGG